MHVNRAFQFLFIGLAFVMPALPACSGNRAGTSDGGAPGSPHGDIPDSGPSMPGDGVDMPGDGDPTGSEPLMPPWARTARIGGLHLYAGMAEEEIDRLLRERQAQNVSVIELDTRLSYYMSDGEFDVEVALIDQVARKAHDLGMRVVIYYPSLEVITAHGESLESSMFKDHPDWVQRNLWGEPNVFYGSKEAWVEPGAESAWMSPNTGYRDYFLDRIRKLASTAVDGLWLDVPLYLETGAAWSGAEPPAREAFHQWTLASGLGGPQGFTTPAAVDFADPSFRAWVRWRHENIADFLEDVRQTVHALDPDKMVIAENFPLDHMGGVLSGFDGTLRRSGQNFIRVWEVDGVSDTRGMQWASIEDFTSQIAMYKWAAACERENLPWSFVYGNEPLDAGLVMAAAVATRNLPFEAKTPIMTESVGHDFRARWFGFLRDHEQALFEPRRMATVGVWYSAATRDYHDFTRGGYGMYITAEPPTDDPDWWANSPGDTALRHPHQGGWRGAAHALVQLRVPFKVITDPGQPAADLEEVSLLWLPSVVAMSDESAAALRAFVARGGTVLATGEVPAVLDELGNPRARSALGDLFGFEGNSDSGPRVHPFGQGWALHRPDLEARDVFGLVGDPVAAARTMSALEQIVRVHVPGVVRLDQAPPGVLVELSRPRPGDDRQYLYIVNFTGLQQPLVHAPVDMGVQYRPPEGRRVLSASVATPDEQGQRGTVPITPLSSGEFRIDLRVAQFALVELTLEAAE